MTFMHPDASTVGLSGTGNGKSADGGKPPSMILPALSVLHHPDPRRVGDRVLLSEIARGGEAQVGRNAPEFSSPGRMAGEPLADRHLSRIPIRLRGLKEGGIELSRGESHTELLADGFPVGSGPASAGFSGTDLDRGVVLELAGTVVLLLHRLAVVAGPPPPRYGLIGENPSMLSVREDVGRVADLEVPVLLRGETGTGKELVARAVHDASPRRSAPFVAVNLASLTPSLSSSQLFGAVKGAFTGSVASQEGFFRRAHGGTLFLDEIGEVQPEVQVLLLRALETGEIYPVGSASLLRVDARIVAATDADLEARVRSGEFRSPLLHRLAGFEIRLPPLRERRDDVGRLLIHFLRQELARLGEGARLDPASPGFDPHWLPPSLVARLARYDWPGNVRQLRNVARQLVIGSRGLDALDGSRLERLLIDASLISTGSGSHLAHPGPPAPAEPDRRKPSEVGEEEMIEALRASRWDIKAAAERLRVSRPSLYNLMETSSKIRRVSDLDPEEIARCHRELAGDLDAMAERLEVSRRSLARRVRELKLE
jgi:two-component system nitrogen regulation response regulator GlnG